MPARSCFTCAACLACAARTAANSRSIFACSSSLTTLVSRAGGRSFTAGYCSSVAGLSGVPAGSPPAQDGMESIGEVEQPDAASASISAIAVRWYRAATSIPEYLTRRRILSQIAWREHGRGYFLLQPARHWRVEWRVLMDENYLADQWVGR